MGIGTGINLRSKTLPISISRVHSITIKYCIRREPVVWDIIKSMIVTKGTKVEREQLAKIFNVCH